MLSTLIWIGIVSLLAGWMYVAHHLAALPYAPECPACHGLTSAPGRLTRLDRVLAACGGAATRDCPRCGWRGRMRWRVAAARARE